MQGLADGYFVLPYTIGHYFASEKQSKARPDQPEFKKAIAEVEALTKKLLAVNGRARSIRSTRNWGRCFGKNAAWRATKPA